MKKTLFFLSFFALLNGLSAQESQTDNDNRIYTIVEYLPTFGDNPNDVQAAQKYCLENMRFPSERGCVSGRIIVEFIVEKDGTLSNIKIRKKLEQLCDEEAIRLVKNMPKWQPAKQKGVPVRVSYLLPINFSLQ
ncbi:MAG: hypothetical protein RLZZ292_2493 [Bacteroidota bacterium]|jgi:protein TonB